MSGKAPIRVRDPASLVRIVVDRENQDLITKISQESVKSAFFNEYFKYCFAVIHAADFKSIMVLPEGFTKPDKEK